MAAVINDNFWKSSSLSVRRARTEPRVRVEFSNGEHQWIGDEAATNALIASLIETRDEVFGAPSKKNSISIDVELGSGFEELKSIVARAEAVLERIK